MSEQIEMNIPPKIPDHESSIDSQVEKISSKEQYQPTVQIDTPENDKQQQDNQEKRQPSKKKNRRNKKSSVSRINRKLAIQIDTDAKDILKEYLIQHDKVKLDTKKKKLRKLRNQKLREIAYAAITKPDLKNSKIRIALLNTLNTFSNTITKATNNIEKFSMKKIHKLYHSLQVQLPIFVQIMQELSRAYKEEKEQITQVLNDKMEREPEFFDQNITKIDNTENNDRATKELQEFESKLDC